jgi:uncharacterized membrane protein YciS (DUF1049 family)
MKYVRSFLWFVFFLVTVIFVSANSQLVSLNYYVTSVKMLLPLLMLLMILLGFVIFSIAFFPRYVRIKTRNRSLQQRIKTMEKEIVSLRNIPIKDVL